VFLLTHYIRMPCTLLLLSVCAFCCNADCHFSCSANGFLEGKTADEIQKEFRLKFLSIYAVIVIKSCTSSCI